MVAGGPRPEIRVVATGGTIASRADARGHATSSLSPEDLLPPPGPGDRGLRVTVEEVDRVNGWNVDPATMLEVARRVRAAEAEGVAGVVVTHGTDTMEETAFLVDLQGRAAPPTIPVVFTGAMRAADELGADGPRNLADALAVASTPEAAGHGVVVVMHERIYGARWVTKAATLGLHPFASVDGPLLGRVTGGRVGFTAPAREAARLADGGLDQAVETVMAVTGGTGDDIRAAVDRGARGLVLVGTGAGNVPGPYVPAVADALDRGVAVVVTSRALGPTAPVYGGPGGGATLLDLGVLDGAGLPPGKARIALMAALGRGLDPDGIRTWFAQV